MMDATSAESPAVTPGRAEATAETIIAEASRAEVPLKLIGGLGCWFVIRSHGAAAQPYRRQYGDVDVIVPKRSRGKIAEMFSRAGFIPNATFNAVQGETRLMFASADGCKVDVFVGGFAMSHPVPFPDAAFSHPSPAARPVELLLTKLQTHACTDKDRHDVAGLLALCPLGTGPGQIDVAQFAAPLGADWGLWRTVTENLTATLDHPLSDSGHAATVAQAVRELSDAAQRVSKSLRWKARARIGDRIPWYESPEEPETDPRPVN
jgi:hypothetical protein